MDSERLISKILTTKPLNTLNSIDQLLQSEPWNIDFYCKRWKQRELAKNWEVMTTRGERSTAWNQSYRVIWCVCMCMCLVCLDLGSFWIIEGVQREREPGKRSSVTEGRWNKTCWPLLSVPPTYLSTMGMLPGAFPLNWDSNQSALSSMPHSKKNSPNRRQSETVPLDRDLWVIWQNGRTCWRRQHSIKGGGRVVRRMDWDYTV